MKKLFFTIISVVVLAGLFSYWLGAPTANELNARCVSTGKMPGQTLTVGSTNYVCPHPSATPTVIFEYLVRTSLSICDDPDTFGNVTNDSWLAMNVFGPAESWKFDGEKWIYMFVPYEDEVGFGWSVDREYVNGFRYPGFGVYKLFLYEGGNEVISDYGPGYYQVRFTKIELSCK